MPMRILLIGAVVFLAAWFTILKPKPAEVPPLTTDDDHRSAGKAVDAAKTAAGQTTETAPTDTAPRRRPRPQTPARGRPRRRDPGRGARQASQGRRRARSRRARSSCSACSPTRPSRGARCPTTTATCATPCATPTATTATSSSSTSASTKLSTYGPLVNDLHVNQSPAVVVIDANLKGRVLTGYVDRISINQVIADARDASAEPDITDPFLRDLNVICGRYELRTEPLLVPDDPRQEGRGWPRWTACSTSARDYRRAFARLDAPAKYRALKADMLKYMRRRARPAGQMKAGRRRAT